jgi:symplekin
MQLLDFKLPPPREMSEEERSSLVRSSVSRIWDGSEDLKSNGEALPPDSTQAGGHGPTEMWMLLLVRMVTRLVEPPSPDLDEGDSVVAHDFFDKQDRLRQTLCDYIMSDFPARYVTLCASVTLSYILRIRLATTWMNEEWYNDRIQLEIDPDWVCLTSLT